MPRCPICKGPAFKVIYMGLPGLLCEDDLGCAGFAGPASWAARFYFDGHFMTYYGPYWRALLTWLAGGPR